MKFGNIIDKINGDKFSAGVQAAFLSVPATYFFKNGTKTSLFVTPIPIDSQTQYGTITTESVNLTAGMQVYEVVLKGQQFNVAETPPSEGDAIEAVINGVTVKRFVTKNTSGRCWGYAEGRQKIWINTTTKKM